ncbi:transcriptional regulator, partial [Pseudotabrizicola alkalilacus]
MAKQAPAAKPGVRGSRTGRPIMALLDLLGRRWTLR